MIKAGIIGATGYTGAELVRMLSAHPDVELTVITSRQYKGTKISDVYPALAGRSELVCEAYDPETFSERVDIAFTALPHKIPMGIVPELLERGVRVVDLSADFRFRNVTAYEAWYQPHTAPELSEHAVYGLCELYHDEIRKARVVGNPGCYPTTILLALVPLLRAGIIKAEGIVSDSKSGVSGAGRGLSLGAHFCEANESFKPYKVEGHRHRPEIEEVLSLAHGADMEITFIPHLLPMTRGMLSTIYCTLVDGKTEEDARKALEAAYSERPFVRLREKGKMPDILHVQHTNFCDIGLSSDPRNGRLVVVSAIDNLVKGASGQAIQNMNIMAGLDERAGLF
ncbi:N-acetyl-gamma-glutamyl-phosphate reductase [Desulfoluna sp.]|uniref:N-acetyl-gamma-glutamyl-phosphate reductase n=1 Tax=Desulfoluna sp. TaxID=2045199 RepID=UPI002606EC13|nr:N-acetyl-gamma-glutamyl-phosphate reductase [Desulfoluna sp.]